jgi:hypothetical protein
VTRIFAYNGDADGLCALQQLRLAEGGSAPDVLVTGVKRDISLLERVQASAGDSCTVLDVSLDVNRSGLLRLLDAGVRVRYFDHHFAGELPASPNFEAHIDLAPNVCTSLLVDRALQQAGKRQVRWAVVGAFGDSLTDEARTLASSAGLSAEETATLKDLGVAINYNAYGETLADLHVAPAELAAEMLPYAEPLEFARRSKTYHGLAAGFRDDMERASRLEPTRRAAGTLQFMLPDAAWARRASGTLANDLAKAHQGNALAIISPKAEGGFLVSIRVPRDCPTSAESFCRRFPTGGGRKAAAGINHLPPEELETFSRAFEEQFRAG